MQFILFNVVSFPLLLGEYLYSVPYVYIINTISLQEGFHPKTQGSSDSNSMSKIEF